MLKMDFWGEKNSNINVWQCRYTWGVMWFNSLKVCDSGLFIVPTVQPKLLTVRGIFYTRLHDVSDATSTPAFKNFYVIT